MNYWILKTEPSAYSWQNLLNDLETTWDGVRNYQARNNIQAMKCGDLALIYHSVSDKKIFGIAQITKEHFTDPSAPDSNWLAIKIKPIQTLKNPISLEKIKSNPLLNQIALIKQPRLSIIPISKEEFDLILNINNI